MKIINVRLFHKLFKHYVCCEDSLAMVHIIFANLMTLTLIQGHNCISDLTNLNLLFNSNISDTILCYGIQTWHNSRLMHAINNNKIYIMLMLILMTLALIKVSDNGLAKESKCLIISTTK